MLVPLLCAFADGFIKRKVNNIWTQTYTSNLYSKPFSLLALRFPLPLPIEIYE